MMKNKTLTLVLAASALAAGSAAYAQPRGERSAEDMTRASAAERAGEAFARMDANGDGVLNEADGEARQKARFDRIDANSDGTLTYEEFNAMHDRRHEARAERSDGEGRKGRRGGMRRMAGFGDGMHRMGQMADTDQDGAVSRAEFEAAALARFDSADTDRDGTLTAAERKAQRDAQREAMRQARRQS